MKRDPAFYEARAFHPDLDAEGVAGRIIFTQFTFQFESETEAAQVEIPCNQLTISLAEDEEGVFFQSDAQPEWSYFAPGHAILSHRIFTNNIHLGRQVQAIFGRKAWRKAVIATVSFLAIALVVGLGISWGIDKLVRFSVNRISPETAKNLGETEYNRLKEMVPVSDDPKLIAELNAIYARLRPCLPDTNMTVEFHILEIETPNAGSLPGHIVVTRGLFDLLTTPDEMAGVMSHEVAHITQKHVFRGIISSQGPARILRAAFRDSSGTLSVVARGSQFMLGRSFSRQYEREADDEGWKYLVAARINPRGFIDALQKLRDNSDRLGVKPGVLSTHPATEERMRRLEAHWDALKDKTGFVELTTKLPE